MTEDFAPVDPYALARNEAAAQQLRRFYKTVSTAARPEGGIAVLLDGRPARTPRREPLVLPTEAAAALVAAEFAAQGEVMRPGTMPVLRLANAVIDGVARTAGEVRADIVRFAGADLLLYRAEEPEALVRRQAAGWDGVLDWARDTFGARFYLAQGVMHVAQPDHALAALGSAVDAAVGTGAAAPFRLGALHVMTTLTGSALLALAVLTGARRPEDAWALAHVDEDYQIEQWGRDEEAETRRDRRWADFAAAAALCVTLPSNGV